MIYVTSDIHGYSFDEFKLFLKKVGFCDDDFCFVLGDVIDRGTDSVKWLKWLMVQPNFQLILGNHEAMLLACDFLFETITEDAIDRLTGTKLAMYNNWVSNGGRHTLDALCLLRESEVEDILDYLRDAPLYDTVTVGERDFVLTHSGLGSFDKNKKLSDYCKTDLLWTRPSLNAKYFDDVITVFGHTPTLYYGEEYKGRAIVTDTWIDIDTGAACGLKPMLLRLDDMQEFYID